LLGSALELAERVPFRDISVEEIAAGAGISRSAFYTHFRDKPDLLLEALGEVSEQLRPAAREWWRDDGAPAERVRRAVEGFISIYAEHAGLLGVATEVATYDDEVRDAWLAIVETFIDAGAERIRSEQRAGLVAERLSARPTAEALTLMCERCCYAYLAVGERKPEQVVAALAPVWTAALYPGVIPADELRPEAELPRPDDGRTRPGHA
jgi:AcrR family transcriptional regulator